VTVFEHELKSAETSTSGGQEIVGALASFTVTFMLHETEWLVASVVVYRTGIVPTENKPLSGLVVVVAIPQFSATMASDSVTDATHTPGLLFTSMLTGQAMVGACLGL